MVEIKSIDDFFEFLNMTPCKFLRWDERKRQAYCDKLNESPFDLECGADSCEHYIHKLFEYMNRECYEEGEEE